MNMTAHNINRRVRGTITHEATMAIVLAAAVLAGAAQTLTIVAHQRRSSERDVVAQREVANIMEEVAIVPWNELTQDDLQSLQLSRDCQQVLRDAELRLEISESIDDSRQIQVELDWSAPNGQRTEPVSLTTWRFPPVEAN